MTKHDIFVHDSVSDFLLVCDAEAHKTSIEAGRTLSSRNNRDDWAGCSYDQAKKYAVNGWEKGLRELSTKLASLPNDGMTRNIIKDVAGSHPDVARYIAGRPDCMNRKKLSFSNCKPCLDIVVNASYSSCVGASHIMNYGAAIASVIDALEQTGYSISLTVGGINKTNDTGRVAGCMVRLKDQGEHLDLGRLAYFVSHPSMLRRLVFAHWETTLTHSELGFGYGMIEDAPKKLQGNLYFGKSSSLDRCKNIGGAVKYVRETIQAQMPELMEEQQAA